MVGWRLAAALAGVVASSAQFNYTFCGMPGTSTSTSVALNETTAVCVHLNGAVSAVYTPTVDYFSAFQLSGSEWPKLCASDESPRRHTPNEIAIGRAARLFLRNTPTQPTLPVPAGNFAFPSGAGYILQGSGWVPNINSSQFNCSANGTNPQTYFATVDVGFLGVATTSPRIYKQFVYDFCTQTLSSVQTIPLLTAIVTLSNGRPSFIAWDDGCIFCAANGASCVFNALDTGRFAAASNSNFMSCFTDSTSCYSTTVAASPTLSSSATPSLSASPANASSSSLPVASPTVSPSSINSSVAIPQSTCDLKLFLVWTGSDSKGQYCTSSNSRFSRFRQYGTATVYQSAINLGNAGLSTAQSALGLANGVPGRLIPGASNRRQLLGREEGAALLEDADQQAKEEETGASVVAAAEAAAAAANERLGPQEKTKVTMPVGAGGDEGGELLRVGGGCKGIYRVRVVPPAALGGDVVHELVF